MSYFRFMPSTMYRGDYDGQFIVATDITTRAKILEYIKDSAGTVVDYNIRDGERPEHLAHRVYGKPEYHWVNLLYNEIHDPFFEWPMSSQELQVMIDQTYEGKAYFIDLNQASSVYANFYMEPGTATVNGIDVTIKSWEPNLYKLVVASNSPGVSALPLGSEITQTRSDGKIVTAIIRRVVDDNRYAVHHFVDQDTNEVVDHHLVNSDPTVESDLGWAAIPDTNSVYSILQRYVNGGAEKINLDNMIVTIKTNYEYEIERNDAKRKIKVMRPEFVDIVVKDLQKVFFGG